MALFFVCLLFSAGNIIAQGMLKPRVLISTDIGGTDPDDNQSMIHLLMYADQFQLEGLLSTAFTTGSKQDILDMISLYEKDLPLLNRKQTGFPHPDSLRRICKQGARTGAPYKGYRQATEGSDWIIHCARKSAARPLWVLVWGGLEDVAQALHDAPDIKHSIRVYWIGGPNKKWGVNAYAYIASAHPDLWMIEANATYRGWFMDASSPASMKGNVYYANYIKGKGAMGADFIKYYAGVIKMGDTPSLAYLMNGNPEQPEGESWGGSFQKIQRSSRTIFRRPSSITDTVATYAVIEWQFKGPRRRIHPDSVCFNLEVSGQQWPGYYLGRGKYAVRYSPKQVETASYKTISHISALNGHTGQYVSVAPWPGKAGSGDYLLGNNWYSDCPGKDLFIGQQQGAVTVARFREAFLMDWARRWEWLEAKLP